MRVTRIPGDFNDIGERPCRVYCNEVEIEGWTVADDFRRVVETPGKVHHGAVRIEMLPEVPELAPEGESQAKTLEDAFHDLAVLAMGAPRKDIHTPARKRKAGK